MFSVAGAGRIVKMEGKMNGAKYRENLDENLLQSAQVPQTGGEGSPSNRTTALSTQPRQRRSSFGTSLWISLSGTARARTWTRSNISGETLKIVLQWRSPSNLIELERICREVWGKLPKYRCAKLVASYPRIFKAVFSAKGASTKYWVKGLNAYVHIIFTFFFIYIC